MGETDIIKSSWESSSFALSNSETSTSRDSCYGSDGTSVTSAFSSTAATSTVPSFNSSPKTSLSPILKPILKKESASFPEDTESESGYDSDAEYDYSFFEENDDEDLYEDSACGENFDDLAKGYSDDELFDDSFITFESMVRFDSKIHYIEAPEHTDDETPNNEMTFHELIERAQAFGHLLLDGGAPDNKETGNGAMSHSEEYTADAVDLDKRLFAAYMNGINGIADPSYKPLLRAHVDHIKSGHAQTPFFDSDTAHGLYLDNVLTHVVGIFRNLVAKDEYDELATLSAKKTALQKAKSPHDEAETCDKTLLDRIAYFLSERLGEGNVEIGPDEMTLFASGVSHALGDGGVYSEAH